MSGLVLHARELARTYQQPAGPLEVIRDVSLVLEPGALVVLTGPSGSGKSTLVALLAGLEPPDRGSVEGLGGAEPPWAVLAVVPQALGLLEDLPVAEAVELPLRLAGVGRAERRRRAADGLRALGLERLGARLPGQLSLGEQQRVAIARALVAEPDVVLLDEPTAHQDAHSTARIVSALRARVDAGGSVLVATHDPSVVEVADRRIHLERGRVVDG